MCIDVCPCVSALWYTGNPNPTPNTNPQKVRIWVMDAYAKYKITYKGEKQTLNFDLGVLTQYFVTASTVCYFDPCFTIISQIRDRQMCTAYRFIAHIKSAW